MGAMKKRMVLISAAVLLVMMVIGGVAMAQISTSYDLSWHVLAGGGEPSTSVSFAANSTVGQATIGWVSNSTYGMGVGYWYGAMAPYRIFLPLVLKD